MKKILMILVPLLFFVGCADDDNDSSNTSGNYDGTWNLTFLGEYANADCSGDIDSTGWAFASAFGFVQTLEIDGESYTMTVSMAGEVMESLSGNFSETNGSPCLDGECISANWVTTGSVWDMDTESDAYCEDADGNDTSDADQTACESADNDWYSESCTQTVWTKQ